MTNEEAIQTLELMKAEIEWEYPIGYQIVLDMAIEALKKESPCDLCRYNPPSSCDEKPCYYCPACGPKIDWGDQE